MNREVAGSMYAKSRVNFSGLNGRPNLSENKYIMGEPVDLV